MEEKKGLLAGMKVLDLSRVLAAPYCGMLLADMGADVIKIERPGKGDDARGNFPIVNGESGYFINLNRDSEVKLYIEDYMLTQERAVEWMGEHNKLKYSDQSSYDEANSDW